MTSQTAKASSPSTTYLPSQVSAVVEDTKDHGSQLPLGSPLLVAPIPSTMMLTGDSAKVIMKVKTVAPVGTLGPPERPDQKNQTFILTQTAVKWITPMSGGSITRALPSTELCQLLSTGKTVLLTKPASVLQVIAQGEDLASRKRPCQVSLAPTAHLAWKTPVELTPAPLIPPRMPPGSLLGISGSAPSRVLGEMSGSSKGVYENFRRWQQYKELARMHFPSSPDTEALACFLIPVLRSLARLKPEMMIEEGVPRAIQEWERISNYDRMVFYEMAEKFMEFEEEEVQLQKVQFSAEGQAQKTDSTTAIEANKQQVYFPKKSACKAAQPKRRQRRPAKTVATPTAKEVPSDALEQYMEVMEALRSHSDEPGQKEANAESEEQRQEGLDQDLLHYIQHLCENQMFVSKVEAVINPSFLTSLLSPEERKDPLHATEELDEEEGPAIDEVLVLPML
ncbi:NUT family member 1 [Ambystoma mexicanum]|uniref:NUT family member 1 n=1 Tax=Ambystoma mexicanum TaxID=8296 RepID=UPI0037E970C8